MRSWLAAVAALALAAVLAVGARMLLAVPGQVQREAGPGLAARLVGAGDDIRIRKSLRLAGQATTSGRNAVRIRSQAEAALSRETSSAQAANLLGVLSVADAAADPANGRKYAGEAVSAFKGAIGLDPGDDGAKFNLELLLTLKPKAAQASAERQATSHGKRGRGNHATPPPAMGY
jgi:hypothetical protein